MKIVLRALLGLLVVVGLLGAAVFFANQNGQQTQVHSARPEVRVTPAPAPKRDPAERDAIKGLNLK